MAFAIEAAPAEGHVVLAVRGEVDIATAGVLGDRVAAALDSRPAVVVDLADVPFMDSTGLGVLVAAGARAAGRGGAVVLARPQRIVKNALRLVHVDVEVYDTIEAAVAAV